LAPALPEDLPEQVSRALREDIGPGDLTASLIDPGTLARAHILCREAATLCGCAWFEETYRQLDARVRIQWHAAEGEAVVANTILCELEGPARALLSGERTALNFLQLLSGTATATRAYVEAIAGTHCQILDTRKTLPGLRTAQKYAVRCGGGSNHRIGLFDQILIKENHVAAAGSITAAVERARALHPGIKIEVETEDLAQLAEALVAGADIIMLDEFSAEDQRRAVATVRSQAHPTLLEVSGGLTLASVAAIAATGVDFISVGALTKHVRAIDLSMRFEPAPLNI
jgi:nicotinate-nucleotide pyrophosphorylase (carboxylating)